MYNEHYFRICTTFNIHPQLATLDRVQSFVRNKPFSKVSRVLMDHKEKSGQIELLA